MPAAPEDRARVATAAGDSGCSFIRDADSCRGISPSKNRSGCMAPSSSSRYVASTSTGADSTRRLIIRTTSSVASSAHCRSSRTTTAGGPARSSASRPDATTYGSARVSLSRARSPPTVDAMSSSGPSGRGVNSGSHAPQSTRAPSCRLQKPRTRAVLPTPASPPIKHRWPVEEAATCSKWPARADSSPDRSSSSGSVSTAGAVLAMVSGALNPALNSRCPQAARENAKDGWPAPANWVCLPIRPRTPPHSLDLIAPDRSGREMQSARGGAHMPRYLVERTFGDGLHIPVNADGAAVCLQVVDRNADEGVTWIHSYVTDDKKKTFCIYDGPNPEAIRKTAGKNSLPVDRITQVSVLDPYFYK